MKIIFLDFDGVLTTHDSEDDLIDRDRMIYLKQLVDTTGAEIVLTTSWRTEWEKKAGLQWHITGQLIDMIFGDFGLSVYSKVPDCGEMQRDREIRQWLKENDADKIEAYVILDDFDFYSEDEMLKTHFAAVDPAVGLDDGIVKKAIKILN